MSIAEQVIQDNPDKYESVLKARILGRQLQLKLNQYNALQSQYDTLLQYENNNHNQAAARDAVCKSRNPGTAIVKDVKTKCRECGCDYALGSTGWIDFCNASNAESTCCGTNNTTVTFYTTSFQDWTDIPNTSYQYGMVPNSTASTDDWKFLGKTDNLTNCKLKAVEDKNTAFSSVVYYPSDFGDSWNKSCFGGVKGGNINPQPEPKTITSLAPNGTTLGMMGALNNDNSCPSVAVPYIGHLNAFNKGTPMNMGQPCNIAGKNIVNTDTKEEAWVDIKGIKHPYSSNIKSSTCSKKTTINLSKEQYDNIPTGSTMRETDQCVTLDVNPTLWAKLQSLNTQMK